MISVGWYTPPPDAAPLRCKHCGGVESHGWHGTRPGECVVGTWWKSFPEPDEHTQANGDVGRVPVNIRMLGEAPAKPLLPFMGYSDSPCIAIYRKVKAGQFLYSDRDCACPYTGAAMFDRSNQPVTDPALDACSKTLDGCKARFWPPMPDDEYAGFRIHSRPDDNIDIFGPSLWTRFKAWAGKQGRRLENFLADPEGDDE